ncbi:MAG: hypothetical protein U1E76_26525 [Planctomycetota bacterium]
MTHRPLLVLLLLALPAAAFGNAVDPAAAFQARHGVRMIATTDASRGVLASFYGKAIPLGARSSEVGDVVRAASAFITLDADLLGVSGSELDVAQVMDLRLEQAGIARKRSIVYRQSAFGLEVYDATLCLVLDQHDNLVALQNQLVPFTAATSTTPRLGAADAVAAAARALGFDDHYEVRELALWFARDDRELPAHATLAYVVNLVRSIGSVPEGYRVLVDAQDGSVISKQSSVLTTDLVGHVGAYATPGLKPDKGSNPPVLTSMQDLSLASAVGDGLADAAGNWTIAYGGNDTQNVTADLASPLISVTNTAGANESQTASVTPGVFADITLNPSPSEFVTSQPNCHRCAIDFHNFVKGLDPGDTHMDFTVKCNVNIASTCNAYYDYSSINFFRAGGGCPNTAYTTVVTHEEGHWANTKFNGGVSGAFHEGGADVWSMYIYDTGIVGQDFFGDGSYVRSGDNGTLYCGNCNESCHGGEPHYEGEVLMGAFWKMRKRLNASLGDAAGDLVADVLMLTWYQAFDQKTICATIVEQLLTLDDDDGDIFNGTPHHVDINGGFVDQGFPSFRDQKVVIEHVAVGESQGTGPIPIKAIVKCAYGEPVSGASLFYSTDVGTSYTELTMSPTGNPDEWQASVPGQPAATTVTYYLTGKSVTGLSGILPIAAPDNDRFVYHVGSVNAIASWDFENPGDDGFTHGATSGTDSFEHGAPLGLSTDPATAASGASVWGTDLSKDGQYDNSSSMWLETPPLDLTGVLHTRLDFHRWLGVEDGLWDQAIVEVNGVRVYTNPGGTPGANADLFDHSWTHQIYDISALADNQPSVVIRFELNTDFATGYGGWNLDDLRVLELIDPAHDCKPSFGYGVGSPGTGGFTPRIFAVNGPANLGNAAFAIAGDRMLGGTVAALLIGAAKTDVLIGPLHLLVDVSLPHLFVPTAVSGSGAGDGSASIGLPIPGDPIYDGLVFYAQWLVTDPAGYSNLALSAGLQTEICANP